MMEPENTEAAREGQPAAELLPVVYAELRRLAVALSGRLPPGQTLQPTALVHEAYLRLVGDRDPGWEGRRHFFGAAARAKRHSRATVDAETPRTEAVSSTLSPAK